MEKNIILYLREEVSSMVVENLITNVYSELVPKIRYAIDIGAHHGIHTKGLLKLPSIEFVLAVEANQSLKETGLLQYESDKCEIIWKAVAPSYCLKDGYVSFLSNPDHLGRSGIEGLHIWKEIDPSIKFNKSSCEAVTLDEILTLKFRNGVDFIKMDIEGAEYAILSNSKNFWEMRPTIVLENSVHALNISNMTFSDFHSLCCSHKYSIIDFNGNEVTNDKSRKSFNHIWLVSNENKQNLIDSIHNGFDRIKKT